MPLHLVRMVSFFEKFLVHNVTYFLPALLAPHWLDDQGDS